jgi:hypothetical protein
VEPRGSETLTKTGCQGNPGRVSLREVLEIAEAAAALPLIRLQDGAPFVYHRW